MGEARQDQLPPGAGDGRKYRAEIIALSALLLFILTWIDYVTGYEFGFFIFYFIPVSIAAWYLDSRWGLIFAGAAGVAWYLSDRLGHHPYSNALFIYWESFIRLISFLTTALSLSRIRQLTVTVDRLERANRVMREENHGLREQLKRLEEPGSGMSQ